MPFLLILLLLMYGVYIRLAILLNLFKTKNIVTISIMVMVFIGILALTSIYINMCIEDQWIW